MNPTLGRPSLSGVAMPIFAQILILGALVACAPAQESAPGSAPQDPQTAVDRSKTDAAASERSPGEDWPRFLGPTQDGKSRETGIRTDWSGGLPILWQLELGEGYSAPTTADGRIFVFDRVADTVRLRALTADTGEELWRSGYPTDYVDMYGYSGGPRTSPAMDGDRVYAFGPEGRLRALRVDDGEVIWQVDTAERYGVRQNFFGVGSSPVIHGELLIAQIGGSPPDSPGIQSGAVQPNGTAVVAFDKHTGEERRRLGDQLASYATVRIAEIDGRAWGLAFTRGGLLGFDPVSFEERFFFPWRAKKLESVNAATPVVVGNKVFLTESYGPGGVLLRIDGAGQEEQVEVIWKDPRRKQSLNSHWSTPIHVDGVLYGCAGQSTGEAELRAVRLETGEVLWSKPGLGRTTLLHVDGHLVVLGEYGELHLVRVDPEAYRPVAHWTPTDDGTADGRPLLAYPAWSGPILSHGVLYVRGKDRLLALELIPRS